MKQNSKKKRRIFLLIAVFSLILILNIGNIGRLFYPVKYIDSVKKYTNEYRLDPYLIMSIIKAESNFNADAVSGKNATGLMQIMEPTAMWLSDKLGLDDFSYEDITDPDTNIRMGCYYIAFLLEHYEGNTDNALAAYNAGQGNVDRWLSDKACSKDGKTLSHIPYPETRLYIDQVTNNEKVYRALYKVQPDKEG
ncbi:MAG: lytic transglycosylase domain-containing protein [Clostridia bacterium]|nr:lytic transglycosylase domain-containing protein [Clostridia bacterium]